MSNFRDRRPNRIVVGLLAALWPFSFAGAQSQSGSSHSPQAMNGPSLVAGSATPRLTYAPIPFLRLWQNGQPIVRVRINDKQDAEFLVATGTQYMTLRKSLADALGIRHSPRGNKAGSIETATLDKIIVGENLQLSGEVLVSDDVPAAASGKPIDGILGANCFYKSAIEFDFERQCLFFVAGNLNATQLEYMGVVGGQDASIPLTVNTSDDSAEQYLGMAALHILGINGKTEDVSVKIDTGSGVTIVPSGLAKPLGEPLVSYELPNGIGPSRLEAFTVDELRVGGGTGTHEADHFTLSPFSCMFLVGSNATFPPTLGLDFLAHFRVLIDYPARRMYLVPVTSDPAKLYPTEASRVAARRSIAGLTVGPSESGIWSIVALGEPIHSPFVQAGFHVGDVISDMNGVTADKLTPSEIASLLRAKQPQLRITVLRDGRSITLSVDRSLTLNWHPEQ